MLSKIPDQSVGLRISKACELARFLTPEPSVAPTHLAADQQFIVWAKTEDLSRRKGVIENGLKTFVEVGSHYQKSATLAATWKVTGLLRRTVKAGGRHNGGRLIYRLIDAAAVVENVRHGAQTAPINERQARQPMSTD
jgi:hypothetical protein